MIIDLLCKSMYYSFKILTLKYCYNNIIVMLNIN